MTTRICIFGASGATGMELVRQAVQRGYQPVAFVRSQPTGQSFPGEVITIVGSLSNQADVERALAGCQVAIIAIGPRPSSPQAFCAEATKTIIAGMKAQGVPRLVCISGAMIGDYPHLSWFMRSMRSSYRKQQPALAGDRALQEQQVESSGLNWTLVKPPRLSNGKKRGRVRSGETLKIGAFSSVSRRDLSSFILDQVESSELRGRRVVVTY